jgi:hypothetical protein
VEVDRTIRLVRGILLTGIEWSHDDPKNDGTGTHPDSTGDSSVARNEGAYVRAYEWMCCLFESGLCVLVATIRVALGLL